MTAPACLTALMLANKLPSYSFIGGAKNASNLSTYTFAAQGIGSPDPTRLVLVCVASRDADASPEQLNTLTIGGISATKLADGGTDTLGRRSIWGAVVPSGSTADIVLSYANTQDVVSISVYALYNLQSTNPYINTGNTNVDPYSTTLNISKPNSIIIASANTVNVGPTWTTTGLNEDYDVAEGALMSHATASIQLGASNAAYSITIDPASGTGNESYVVGVWR